MYSLTLRMQDIAMKLNEALDAVTLRWKTGESPVAYAEGKPRVFCYTYDDTDGDLPVYTPSVLVQCISMNGDGKCNFVIHCCICNPAIQATEKTSDPEGDGTYTYGTGTEYTSSTVRSDLYRACLMLGEYVFLELQKMGNNGEPISDLVLTTPSPFMESFPYCECTISCTISIANEIKARNNTVLRDFL